MTPAEFRTKCEGYADSGNLMPLWLADRLVPFTQGWVCLSPLPNSAAPRGAILERKPFARKILAEFVAVDVLDWMDGTTPERLDSRAKRVINWIRAGFTR